MPYNERCIIRHDTEVDLTGAAADIKEYHVSEPCHIGWFKVYVETAIAKDDGSSPKVAIKKVDHDGSEIALATAGIELTLADAAIGYVRYCNLDAEGQGFDLIPGQKVLFDHTTQAAGTSATGGVTFIASGDHRGWSEDATYHLSVTS